MFKINTKAKIAAIVYFHASSNDLTLALEFREIPKSEFRDFNLFLPISITRLFVVKSRNYNVIQSPQCMVSFD